MIKTTIKDCPINLSGIYKIDFPNGKCYIGKAVDIKRRISEHNIDTRQLLYLPITKYFQNNIPYFYILEETSREKLSEREIYWIAFYESNNKEKGYNLTPGGDGAALGINNVASKFSQEDLDTIVKLLLETDIPMYKIAEEYNCNRITIERLNSGETYFNNNLKYPIRQEKYIPKSGCENGNSSLNQEQLNNLIEDLINTVISMKELATKYGIASNTLSQINNGKSYKNKNLNYPLRKKNSDRIKTFSREQLEKIKILLEQPAREQTMTKIGKEFNCSRDIISQINNGTRQKQSDWTYPIRK